MTERWPNLHLVDVPVRASWLNRLMEIYFSIVQRKVLTPNDFANLTEVEERLLTHRGGGDLTSHYQSNPERRLGPGRGVMIRR